jgi:hypothetical protein
MGTTPDLGQPERARSPVWAILTAAAVAAGLVLLVQCARGGSATYDEVAYLRVASRWWRTGDQNEITRMGSPLTFWKIQQVPTLFLLDHTGHRDWVDDPIAHQRALLPWVRIGSSWIWLLALGLTAAWSRARYGPRAMALAAWLFVLSPNLIAHGALATMEMPLIAGTTAMCGLFWRFLDTRRVPWLVAAAVAGGVAFSCKFTAIIFVPILAAVWAIDSVRKGERDFRRSAIKLGLGLPLFLAIMLLVDWAVTGFATAPLSTTRGPHPTLETRFGPRAAQIISLLYETPIPQDWVGLAVQSHHQRSGGASYLWGETRMTGWWYYYLVAIFFKVPVAFWLLAGTRLLLRGITRQRDQAPLLLVLFLVVTAVGSSRNYGVRYVLPLAPLAIVWVSALAEVARHRFARLAVFGGVAGYAVAIATIHPHELTYFNVLAGGARGGRHILADSNLDWGQGLLSLAALQERYPEFRDLTLYYFGDTEPEYYGVTGTCHVIRAVGDYSTLPPIEKARTRFVAVSASLQWGPWGPPRHFRDLDGMEPVAETDDSTIAIYRVNDLAIRPTYGAF